MSIKVSDLREFLNKYSDDDYVYAYSGESTCVVVMDKDGKQLGFIDAYEPYIDYAEREK
ncbi:MAG TPA: hypothetical protein VMW39_06885 [bacterium]|nr:hypothetical protein [bacterium]